MTQALVGKAELFTRRILEIDGDTLCQALAPCVELTKHVASR